MEDILEDILSDEEEDTNEPMREGSDSEFSDLGSDNEEGKYTKLLDEADIQIRDTSGDLVPPNMMRSYKVKQTNKQNCMTYNYSKLIETGTTLHGSVKSVACGSGNPRQDSFYLHKNKYYVHVRTCMY